ncbi:MAG: efflux RND transporter periplasmic adaptor subunit, partial [Xanthomonadales bacterium]|nr:efflux RND transporter periplasmic adaptor subunit [Xanthomonadales bacterium]
MSRPSLDELKIDRPEPKNSSSSLTWLAVVVLAAAVIVTAWYFLLRPEPALEVSTVRATPLNSGAPQAGTVLNASGYVNARRYATVSSKITGRVIDVLIEEGMAVEEGQVLARLDDSNIRAAWELARAQLVSAERGLGETRALLEEAENNHERQKRLVSQNLASAAELDRARALAVSLAARAERNLADVEVARRQIDIYQRQLDDTVIRAPFAGIIVGKNAQPGEMVSPVSAGGGFTRTGIGTIVDMSSLEIEIDVNEAYINRISPGQSAEATLDAYPDWKIPAHVIAIIPTADRQRATVEVRVGIDELDDRILPDMGVKVAFHEAEEIEPEAEVRRGVLVPAGALRRDAGRDIVFVASSGTAERRAVSARNYRDGTVLVESGLQAGESVVV